MRKEFITRINAILNANTHLERLNTKGFLFHFLEETMIQAEEGLEEKLKYHLFQTIDKYIENPDNYNKQILSDMALHLAESIKE